MRRKRPAGECTIPPAIPDTALPALILKRDLDAETAIRNYVEGESQLDGDKVTHAERITTEYALGQKYEAWDVRTTKGRWWVITSPTNLYSQELFPSLDYTISFHIGVTARVMSRATPRVERMEETLLAAAWRKWQQAAEALDEAEEPEDFQSVGMRCRESLIAMVKTLAKPEMVAPGDAAPKRADVSAWSERIADHIAHGSSAKYVRGYMKASAKSGWDLVSWLTHASGATRVDAIMALEATQHTLATYSTAVFRHNHGIPDRCPSCGSYQIGLRQNPDDPVAESVPGCRACGWLGAPRGSVTTP
jgi:hypothetical protein